MAKETTGGTNSIEWCLYDRICKDKFETLEKKIDSIRGYFIAGLTGLVAVLAVQVIALITR